jgi:hypothetical protein
MAKYNKATVKGPISPLVSVNTGVKTANGMVGAEPTAMTELFKLGVNLFANEGNSFYEKGKVRDKRFTDLVEQLAVSNPEWTVKFLVWLRSEANIRTAAVIGAAHFVKARLKNKSAVKEDELLSSLGHKGLNRHVISEVLSRADEPGEFVAYWMANFGKLPKPVKRGIADSVLKLYNEYAVLKYDTTSHDIRFSDVLNLTHAKPRAGSYQGPLFKYVIDKRYDNEASVDGLKTIYANKVLRNDAAENVKVLLDPVRLKAAGMTWEDVLSLGGSKLKKKDLWESVIPSMGVFALVRNLRNFEEEGISDASRKLVVEKITNPDVIAKSRMLPFRFYTAYKEVNSLQFKAALEEAVRLSCSNIPEFDGPTLVLVDVSGSMTSPMSTNSKVNAREAASLFGAALAAKNPHTVTLAAFADSSRVISFKPGESILPLAERITRASVGGGTNTPGAVRTQFKTGHKRVIILTDEQANYSSPGYSWYYRDTTPLGSLCPDTVWMYSFNLVGYRVSQMETGSKRRYQLGGLTDNTFKMIPMLESGDSAKWPWDVKSD